ncbi:polyprenol monophosphomannose synthase [Aeromicrobium senzhongii]|uniref:Polyprenol monophosphomannose synthase n=1 Tax=Aeromicrobium senzhongii TaxID=2663859 RepID=A0ABX6SV67_9ACTN|nr:polyprenol monophosphomannose synthase [Aeromicrobium senzhongii]MTB87079.1 glycosyltransferase [Aeromicrobium senzhongii]QNL93105.1 polyprenol monophosphomannose synthase [Aeromicrobium senzhongii]
MKTLIIIPTYNEADNVGWICQGVLQAQPDVEILVADDNSPDGTGEIADKLAVDDPRIHVLHRQGKEGLGAAYRAGFAWGLERGYDVLVEMDADGSHRPEDLGKLLDSARSGVPLTLGSRWVPGGSVVNWPKRREALSRGASLYARLMLNLGVKDATAGFRAFRRETLEAIDLDAVESQGYCFQIDMTRQTRLAGLEVAEVPVTFVERVHGQSKMSLDIVKEALTRVTVWGLQRMNPFAARR